MKQLEFIVAPRPIKALDLIVQSDRYALLLITTSSSISIEDYGLRVARS